MWDVYNRERGDGVLVDQGCFQREGGFQRRLPTRREELGKDDDMEGCRLVITVSESCLVVMTHEGGFAIYSFDFYYIPSKTASFFFFKIIIIESVDSEGIDRFVRFIGWTTGSSDPTPVQCYFDLIYQKNYESIYKYMKLDING